MSLHEPSVMSNMELTWKHYVQKVCKKKNVINMSKNHRHYVHLCTAAWQLFWVCFGFLWCCQAGWGRREWSTVLNRIKNGHTLQHPALLLWRTPLNFPQCCYGRIRLSNETRHWCEFVMFSFFFRHNLFWDQVIVYKNNDNPTSQLAFYYEATALHLFSDVWTLV